jgi:hypothetical protein
MVRPGRSLESINMYRQKSVIQKFTVSATRRNLVVDITDFVGEYLEETWSKSSKNPETIVRGFSQLRIKDGYKLRAYQYIDNMGGIGCVFAIPSDMELPEVYEVVEESEDHDRLKRPDKALPDFMEAINGDKSPLSYLQAAIAFQDLKEFGAMWHSTSWGQDIILPVMRNSEMAKVNHEWDMIEEEPDILEPHFYYDHNGHPVIVFYTINDIYKYKLIRYVNTFSKENYTLKVDKTIIATAGIGIIF